MADKYKVGDIVVLKSGGPKMTVDDLNTYEENEVSVSWFGGKKLEKANLNVDAIRLATDEDK